MRTVGTIHRTLQAQGRFSEDISTPPEYESQEESQSSVSPYNSVVTTYKFHVHGGPEKYYSYFQQ